MSETRYIHIRNWDVFQHPDVTRNQRTAPPWIKDYVGQLHNDDWLELTFAQRGILQGLRLMYAARGGKGFNEGTARTLLTTNKGESKNFRRHLEALNHAGFITFSASKTQATPLASCGENAGLEATPPYEDTTEVEKLLTQGLTEARGEGNGPGSQNLKNEEGGHAGDAKRRLRAVEADANGSHSTPSPSDGPLGDAVVNELARAKAAAEDVW